MKQVFRFLTICVFFLFLSAVRRTVVDVVVCSQAALEFTRIHCSTSHHDRVEDKLNNKFNNRGRGSSYNCVSLRSHFPRSCESSLGYQRRMEITAINFAAMTFMHRRCVCKLFNEQLSKNPHSKCWNVCERMIRPTSRMPNEERHVNTPFCVHCTCAVCSVLESFSWTCVCVCMWVQSGTPRMRCISR